MKKLLLLILVISFSFSMIMSEGMSEQKFPNPEKNFTIYVGFSAGGGTDLIFREFAECMKEESGMNFIISNIPGGGSAVATNELLNGEADGYSLLASGTHTVSATLQGQTKGFSQLDYVASLNWDPFIIAVHKDSPYNTFEELINAAKTDPGTITLGNAGQTGATGVASIGINLKFNKIFNVTAFQGGAELIPAVLGKHCVAGIFSQSEVINNIDGLKPLVILTPERSILSALKDVPTLNDVGYNFSVPGGSFRSISVKKGTPETAVKYLADVAEKAFYSDRFQKFMNEKGLIPFFKKTSDYEDYDQTLINDYIPILKEAGLYNFNK